MKKIPMSILENFCCKVSNNIKENEKIFFDVGNFILNNFILHSKFSNTKYFISDVEFYISSPTHNIDVSDKTNKTVVHCTKRQLLNSEFYIHRIGSTFALIQGAGIDLCFGNNNDIYAGILIREIINIETGEKFHGPQKVLRTLLNLPLFYGEYKQTYIERSQIVEAKNIYNPENQLYLEKLKNPNYFQVIPDLRVNVPNKLLYRIKKI
ncbi:hypothetical protein HDR60_02220 [bacterium]|nr:hypothetical protein [bacterium]